MTEKLNFQNNSNNIELEVNKDKKISLENFFISTRAIFIPCEKPTQEANFISPKSKSEYYYMIDENGEYVIRGANHWIRLGQEFKKPKTKGACFWEMDIKSDKNVDFTDEISPSYQTLDNSSLEFVYGKCYIKDFKEIKDTE